MNDRQNLRHEFVVSQVLLYSGRHFEKCLTVLCDEYLRTTFPHLLLCSPRTMLWSEGAVAAEDVEMRCVQCDVDVLSISTIF